MMSLVVFFFIFILLWLFRGSWFCGLSSYIKFRKILLIISSNISFGSLSTFGTPSKNMLDHLLLSHLRRSASFPIFTPFILVWIISMDLYTGLLFPLLCSFC